MAQISRRELLERLGLAASAIAAGSLIAGCKKKDSEPPAPPAASVPPDDKVYAPIAEAWQRISAWLAKNAPKIAEGFNKPATEQQIQEAIAKFKVEPPAYWKEYYGLVNGTKDDGNPGTLFYGLQVVSLEQAVFLWEDAIDPDFAKTKVKSADPGIRMHNIANPKWIPFALNILHDGLHIDMDPGEGGHIGQVIYTDKLQDTAIMVAPSLAALMWDFVADLEKGVYTLHKEALTKGIQALVPPKEMDIESWDETERWKHLKKGK